VSGPVGHDGDPNFLDLEDLLGLTRRLGAGPVRDVGLLDAAAGRPRASAFGVPAYPTIEEQAAALLHSLVRSHPLVDGNKRLGWLAAIVFLAVNDVHIEAEDDAAFDLVMATAAGEMDVPELATWFAAHR
jgi:death-on-curing protein